MCFKTWRWGRETALLTWKLMPLAGSTLTKCQLNMIVTVPIPIILVSYVVYDGWVWTFLHILGSSYLVCDVIDQMCRKTCSFIKIFKKKGFFWLIYKVVKNCIFFKILVLYVVGHKKTEMFHNVCISISKFFWQSF